ncbi:MAG: sensor histidine kinase [Leptonema sp. (in: bacteria)]
MLWWLYFFFNTQDEYFALLDQNEVLILRHLNKEPIHDIIDINKNIYFDPKEKKYKINPEIYNQREQLKKKNQTMFVSEALFFLFVFLIISLLILIFYHKKNQLLMEKIIFLNSFTHELKTPITAIKLNLQTLLKKNNKKNLELLETSIYELNLLNHKINQILFDKEIQLPSFKKIYNINLDRLVKEILEEIDYEIKKKKCKIHFQTLQDMNHLWLYIPERWLSLILKELFINAIKYSAKEIIIKFSLFKSLFKKYLQITVIDYKDKNYNYLPKMETSGLGLFYIKEILKRCKGDIKIRELENGLEVNIFIIVKNEKKL